MRAPQASQVNAPAERLEIVSFSSSIVTGFPVQCTQPFRSIIEPAFRKIYSPCSPSMNLTWSPGLRLSFLSTSAEIVICPSELTAAKAIGKSSTAIVVPPPVIQLRASVPAHTGRDHLQRFGQGEQQNGARLQRGLRMADQQMGSHRAGPDQAAGYGANRAAQDRASDHPCAHRSAILDAIALQARVRPNRAFAPDFGFGTWGSGNLRVQPVARAVGQSYRLRPQAHGAVTARMAAGNLGHPAVDLRAGGNQHLAALQHVRGHPAAEGFALFAGGGREPGKP